MKVLTIMMIFLLMLASLYINGVQSSQYDIIYDARLSGGSSGTVQVLTHLGWQNLCSSSWSTYNSSEESMVLCRQLGYNVTSSNPITSRSSSSSTSSYFNSFYCSGSESALSECNYNLYDERSSCSYVVSVTCPSCTNGSVQLRGGLVPEAGTVEYCASGTWKAVCDNRWDHREAFVVCRQLGFPATGAISYQDSYFGDYPLTSGLYFHCFGNESSLSSCQSFTTTCNFANTAGVYCTGNAITELCINGHMRLVGGRDTREGRVEICSNGVWGTIFCGSLDGRVATVVCRQLGLYQPYSRVEIFCADYFGGGNGPILYAYLNCDGTELTLRDCSRSLDPLYYDYLRHAYDAEVRCNRVVTTTRSDCSNGDVRLVNGTTPSEGRVEICYNGVWGSVCDSRWSDHDAAIVCLQLNFQGTNATALTGSYFGSGTGPYHLSHVFCSGEERTLLECSYSGNSFGYLSCGAGRDAGVRCDASTCTHGQVRLFGGYSDYEGIAEVCINGFWADICDNGVSNQTVRTFCRQFIGAEAAYASSSCCLRQGNRNTGNITLYGITCSGQSGSFIQDCTYSTVSGSSSGGCSLHEELIVGCYELSNCTNGDIRLSGGNSTSEGRVEICSQGVWGAFIPLHSYPGPFLPDYYFNWDYNGAMVVCRQLGYPSEWAIAVADVFFGRSQAQHESRNFQCTGTETHISNCSSLIANSSALTLTKHPSAGVICQGNTSAPTECDHGEVRLVSGRKSSEGRVEICANGYWATVCYRYWGTVETELVCKQLGFPSDGSEYRSDSPFGLNYYLPIVPVSCVMSDTNISQCNISTQLIGCNHRNGIGIFCQEREQYYFVKIDKLPDQQTYDIGSHVTLKCTVSDLNETSYVTAWSSAFGFASSSHTKTPSIPAYSLTSIDYYCQPSRNGRLLGRQRITLDIKDLLQRNVSGTNHVPNTQVRYQETVHLQVEPVNIDILKLHLLNLTWYHNGSVIAASQNQIYMISNRNKTLTITNFTYADTGVYVAQFNQLFVHPFDEHCRDEVLSLLRHLPLLKPAVFCVNMEGRCPDKDRVTQLRTISLEVVQSELKGTLKSLTLKAYGKVFSSKELKYSSIQWYRNGQSIYFSLSSDTIQRHYTELSLSQELKLFNISYEHSGRYEVLLQVNTYNYLRDRSCRPYYDRFTRGYLRRDITLARGYVDIDYYKDVLLTLTADKEAATRDEGATLTCTASIGFPPFSAISFIKNGKTVATSTSGQLQIDTKSVNANPFGLYICQLNASGLAFNETIILKDQALIMVKIDIGSTNICNEQDKSAIEDAFVSKVTRECQCSFDHNDLCNSSIVCKGNELVYTATMEYSSEDGSETASVIAGRIVSQAPFAMAIGGMPVTVTSACSDCQNLIISNSKITAASLSPAAGGGLFFGGFLTALVVIGIIIIVIMVIMKTKCNNKDQPGHQHAAQPDPISDSKGNLVRNPSYCVHRRMRVEVSLQKQDYEEVEIVDQPVYEAAF